MITLINFFHNTSVNLRPSEDGVLSPRQVQRARRILCPVERCTCIGHLREGNPQHTNDIIGIHLEPMRDGRIRIRFG